MSKYDVKTYDIPVTSQESTWTDEEREIYNSKVQLLKEHGIDISIYTDGTEKYPVHPDGIHNYRQDSALAIKLVLREDKELPDDLKERLLYYKSIMEQSVEE